jgi:hypothetical protein
VDIESVYSNLLTFYNVNNNEYKFLNPRMEKLCDCISWKNYKGNEKFENYDEYYQWALDNVQYSFMFSDESMIQVYFEGVRKKKKFVITKGSMSYLPMPKKYSEYFRFDLDYDREEDYVHTSYHIHFGYRSKDIRFSLMRFPYPSEFIKMILFLDYDKEVNYYNRSMFMEDLRERSIEYNHALDFVVS